MAIPPVWAELKGKSGHFDAMMGRSGGKLSRFSKEGSGHFRGLSGVAKGALLGVGVAAVGLAGEALGSVRTFFSESIAGARESAKVGALTNAVIKSTGGAAKLTAVQVGDLATAISNKTGVDDEAIQSGENLLLTFTNIHNAAGKNNDIFNQATTTAVDMSVALGQDMKSSSIQLGKALNDPIKGVTALQRVGVSFTASQKDQIKTMVKSGDTLGAQKLILAELSKEFGGAAAAASTPAEKARVAWGNFQEMLGGMVLPAIDRLATFFTTTLLPGVQSFITALRSGTASGAGFAGFMSNAGVKALQFGQFFKADILPALKAFASFLTGTVVPAVASFGGWLMKYRGWIIPVVAGVTAMVVAFRIYTTILALVRAATIAWIVVQAILNVALTANPIGIVIMAIVGLVAMFVVAWKRSETFRAVVTGAWNGIKAAAMAVARWFMGTLLPAVLSVWNGIKTGIMAAVRFIIGYYRMLGQGVVMVVGFFIRMYTGVRAKVVSIIQAVAGMAAKVIGFIVSIPGRISGVGAALVQGLANGIRGAAHRVLDAVRSLVDKIPQKIRSMLGISSPSRVTAVLGQAIAHGLALGIHTSTKTVVKTAQKLIDGVRAAMSSGLRGASSGLMRVLTREDSALERLARRRDIIIKRLADAEKAYTKVLKARADYAAKVADSVAGFASITAATGEGPLNSDMLLAQMQARISQVVQFSGVIDQLRKGGLNSRALDDIIQKGPEEGYRYALALAGGGKDAIDRANGLQSQLAGAAKRLGAVAGNAMYAAGVSTAAALVRGLRSQEKHLAAAMLRLARLMASQIRKALQIRSPSRVGHGIGENFGLSLAGGVLAAASAVQSAVAGLAPSPQFALGGGYRAPGRAAGTSWPDRDDRPIVVQLNVDGHRLVEALVPAAQRRKQRTGTSGLA